MFVWIILGFRIKDFFQALDYFVPRKKGNVNIYEGFDDVKRSTL